MCNSVNRDLLSSTYKEYPQISSPINLDRWWSHKHHPRWTKAARTVQAIPLSFIRMKFLKAGIDYR